MTMREILFRGKRLDNGGWARGFLVGDNSIRWRDDYFGCEQTDGSWQQNVIISFVVDPETVGQFTGLTDKNGKPIFEGDIIKLRLLAAKMEWKGVCEYRNGAFGLAWQYAGQRYSTFAGTCNAEYEVLGNIYDNGELIHED